mmetsp:Transcript_11854/g.37983  ORF Transcript_11854/g.37983 Transcript_11854/m.37983 type:complete len:293 (-) Transcript_11854:1283-2161(-)
MERLALLPQQRVHAEHSQPPQQPPHHRVDDEPRLDRQRGAAAVPPSRQTRRAGGHRAARLAVSPARRQPSRFPPGRIAHAAELQQGEPHALLRRGRDARLDRPALPRLSLRWLGGRHRRRRRAGEARAEGPRGFRWAVGEALRLRSRGLGDLGDGRGGQRCESGRLDAEECAEVAPARQQRQRARRAFCVEDEREGEAMRERRHGTRPEAKHCDAFCGRGEAHLPAELAARGEGDLPLPRQPERVELAPARNDGDQRLSLDKDCEGLDGQAPRRLRLGRTDEGRASSQAKLV